MSKTVEESRENKFKDLLKRVISEGIRGFSVMKEEYHWTITTELKEEIEKALDE